MRSTDNIVRQLTRDEHSILSSLPVAACVVDSRGYIIGLNPEGENLLEWGEEACLGKPLHNLLDCTLSSHGGTPSTCPISQVLCSGLPIQIPQTFIRTRGGTLRPIEFRCAPFTSATEPAAIITWRDISQQIQMENDLHRLASMPEESPNPIVEFNQDTTLLYANPAMMELISRFGFDDAAFPAILPPHLSNIVHNCLRTGATCGRYTVTRDNHSYEWTFFPVPHMSLVRGYGINLTEHLRLEAELREAKETAEAANRVKSDFLATISHELRTPLNGVIGMVDLLRMTALTTEQQEYTEIAKRSAANLLSLVNDILDLSKKEAGKLKLEYVDFNLSDMTRQTIALFSSQASEKKLSLRCDLAPGLPIIVHGDFTHLQQVLINLLGNAVKFTDQGKVVLTIQRVLSLEPERQNSHLLRFTIKDTGIGIPENRRDSLFQIFSQVDASTTRKYSGAGLGLAISKQLVELMGGSIGFESTIGQGSTFWFTVPLEPQISQESSPSSQKIVDEVRNPLLQEEQPLSSLDRISPEGVTRLLLVEDNPINQKLAVRLLKKFGYEVDVAHNGREAVTKLSHYPYEAVLMDCQMPEMDGFEATKEIRRRESELSAFPHNSSHAGKETSIAQSTENSQQSLVLRVPIIALTANATMGDQERCLAAGMDDYLTKPLSPTKLRETLRKWLPRILT